MAIPLLVGTLCPQPALPRAPCSWAHLPPFPTAVHQVHTQVQSVLSRLLHNGKEGAQQWPRAGRHDAERLTGHLHFWKDGTPTPCYPISGIPVSPGCKSSILSQKSLCEWVAKEDHPPTFPNGAVCSQMSFPESACFSADGPSQALLLTSAWHRGRSNFKRKRSADVLACVCPVCTRGSPCCSVFLVSMHPRGSVRNEKLALKEFTVQQEPQVSSEK